MEVHHHAHTSRKKWTHYLWEFLMLFFAVFCGFLAEYKLEHTIEYNRTKEYANSFSDDLIADTTNIINYKKYMTYTADNVDSLLHMIAEISPEKIPTGKLYYYGLFGGTPIRFVPNEATLQQMKSSGTLRYFRNRLLLNHVARYDMLIRSHEKLEQQDIFLFAEVRKIRSKICYTRYNNQANDAYQSFYKSGNKAVIDSFLSLNPPVLSTDKIIFNEYAELVRSRFFRRRVVFADSLLQYSRILLTELKKEYHVK
jgi:hypothetical protein